LTDLVGATQHTVRPKRIYCYFSVFEPLFARIADIFEERYDATIYGGFMWGRDQRDRLVATGRNWERLDVFSEWLDELPREVDLLTLQAIEARYGLPNLALIVFADRFLALRPYDEILRILALSFAKVEGILGTDRPDAMIFESIDGLVTLAFYTVAQSLGIPTYVLDAGRIVGRVAVHRDYQHRWRSVDASFERMRTGDLDHTERAAAQRFLDEFRARRPRPPYLAGSEPSLRFADLQRLVRGTVRYMKDRDNITLTPPRRMIGQRATRFARDAATRVGRYFEEPAPGERYVLFPLHFQPETTTLVCAPFFVDQLSLIEDIARCLPVGVRLYVKEHFGSIGRRPLADYRRIQRVWNARLISPRANSFDLIAGADAVVTITSTMGWEAILFERPVICLGEVFYKTFPLVVRAGDIPKTAWPALFSSTLRDWRPDRELLLRYIAAVLAGTFAETVLFDNPSTRPAVMEPSNVEQLASLYARALGLET
jgi:hypothetical protein